MRAVEIRQVLIRRQDRFERKDRVLLGGFIGALKTLHPPLAADGRIAGFVANLAFERRGQHRDDAGERIGAFGGGEPHHAEHDHETRHGGRRGAEPRVEDVPIVEQFPHAHRQRRVVFHLDAVDDLRHLAGSLVTRQRHVAGGSDTQHRSERFEIGEGRSARFAMVQMRRHGNLPLDGQFPVVEGFQLLEHRRT